MKEKKFSNKFKAKTVNHKSSLSKKTASVENPFDKFANSRKKHDVLNRRVKGEDRNVGRARTKVNHDFYR
jgi:hypothetical protein